MHYFSLIIFFFFNDPATTEIYTLSLHDALPIFEALVRAGVAGSFAAIPERQYDHPIGLAGQEPRGCRHLDRKSTRLNSSHPSISYAVFCLKKKKIPTLIKRHNTLQDNGIRHCLP